MRILLTAACLLLFTNISIAQTNILSTNPLAEEIMRGNYDVADYLATNVLNHPEDIIPGIESNVSADSLKSYLIKLATFENRNTGADTTSLTTGIGAARNWVYAKFQEISNQNESRLIPSFLQFDQNICGMGQHRDIFAVLPGIDPNDQSIIIIEGHMDSRCAGLCDIDCTAHGVEDNATGTALVIELARVMSQYSFSNTIVFMATIGEEQGLYGANAFAEYAVLKSITIEAVFNNDVIGGVICGETSSPPSCPGLNDIDSTQVRLFSYGDVNSPHKSLARFTKLEYMEELISMVDVPMLLTIMSAEDRTGRGGDHIPFRQNGFSAIRMTSANEHGNANASDPNYNDRQHTTGDILGVDTNNDQIIDSFFVDFNYLARNTVINGVASGMAAIGPQTPNYTSENNAGIVTIEIDDPNNYDHYRIGLRRGSNDFDTLFTIQGTTEWEFVPEVIGSYKFSVCSVDTNGIESLFSREDFYNILILGTEEVKSEESPKTIELLQNKPNPFDEATYISFLVNEETPYRSAYIIVTDLDGNEIKKIKTMVKKGLNEVLYTHGYNVAGTFIYSLQIDGKIIDSRSMIFSN
jgi:Peptidase family M28